MAGIHPNRPYPTDMTTPLTVEVQQQLSPDPEWDALVQRAQPPSIFMTSPWLAAWSETLTSNPLMVLRVRRNRHLVAAAAFEATEEGIRFAGHGPSDYADVLIGTDSSDAEALEALRQLLAAASHAQNPSADFDLKRIPPDSRSAALLRDSGFFVTTHAGMEAPCMSMAAAPQALKKKSLVRHERGLAKRGALESMTWKDADDILPRLNPFFDLHVKRWQQTTTPSLFLSEANRQFYRRVTEHMSPLGALRYTEIRLDGQLVAAHFGFSWLGRFTWYKPCFDPDLARLSPGEVLIKRLIELAVVEGASCFDFTIGNEAFKYRFATEVPKLVNVHLTRSRIGCGLQRARRALRGMINGR
jgi:CelD/BcsL family acetyltransferase involved in cellulose biosynthesis